MVLLCMPFSTRVMLLQCEGSVMCCSHNVLTVVGHVGYTQHVLQLPISFRIVGCLCCHYQPIYLLF